MGNWWLKPIKWILLANYKNVVMIGHFPFWKLAIWGEMPVYCIAEYFWIRLRNVFAAIYSYVCWILHTFYKYTVFYHHLALIVRLKHWLWWGKYPTTPPRIQLEPSQSLKYWKQVGGGWMRANGRRWIKMINIFWFTESQTDIYMNENWLFILNKQWVNH